MIRTLEDYYYLGAGHWKDTFVPVKQQLLLTLLQAGAPPAVGQGGNPWFGAAGAWMSSLLCQQNIRAWSCHLLLCSSWRWDKVVMEEWEGANNGAAPPVPPWLTHGLASCGHAVQMAAGKPGKTQPNPNPAWALSFYFPPDPPWGLLTAVSYRKWIQGDLSPKVMATPP